MSKSLWCDKSEHSFSSKDRDKQHFTQTHTVKVATGNSYGITTYQPQEEVTDEIDICGPCFAAQNPFQPTPREITEAERESDKSEAAMWKSKYEAEAARNSPRPSTIHLEPEP